MKKLLYKIILVVALTISFASCVDDLKFGNEFLDVPESTQLNKDSVFSNAEYSRRFLWNAYSHIYFGLPTRFSVIEGKMNMGMFETLSDCWHSSMNWDQLNRSYYPGSHNAGAEDAITHTRFNYMKEGVWEGVRKAWIFINNVDRVPNMDAAEKAQLKAEAKIIVASLYFDLFRHFGGLPIIDKDLEPNDNTNIPRATVLETTDFMTGLLDEAIATPELPWRLDAAEYQNWDGRMTKAVAMGLKAKILLFAASPLFNDDVPYSTEQPQEAVEKRQVWTGGYKPELWTRCKQACEDFFATNSANGDVYHLLQPAGTTMSDYRKAFQDAYYTRGAGWDNPEMILSTRGYRLKFNVNPYNFYIFQAAVLGSNGPTFEFMEMFPLQDGTAFDFDNPEHKAKIATERDPRMFETILMNMEDFQGRKAQLWEGGLDLNSNQKRFSNGIGCYKFVLDYTNTHPQGQAPGTGLVRNRDIIWPYLRMAELHLIYAEALMKSGDLAGAIQQVNKVRNRVGLKNLELSNPKNNINDPAGLLKEILRERACELGLEDVRLFDMIRHKLEADFTKKLHGLYCYRKDGINAPATLSGGVYTYPTEFRYEKEVLRGSIERSFWNGGFSPKWYLSPFPPSEINKNYGLTQNPGW